MTILVTSDVLIGEPRFEAFYDGDILDCFKTPDHFYSFFWAYSRWCYKHGGKVMSIAQLHRSVYDATCSLPNYRRRDPHLTVAKDGELLFVYEP